MKIGILSFVLLCLCISPAFAQQRLITCTSERNPDNSIIIVADSRAFGDYTIKMIFTSLTDYTTSEILTANALITTVRQGRKEIIKLKNRLSSASPFQYHFEYFPGKALRKMPDTSFLYLLPAAANKTVRISKVSSVAERLGQNRENDYSGTGFVYKLGDTICAARAGLVYACNDDILEGEKTDDFYKSERNKIRIQHNDGSLSSYDILAPIQLLVSPGENIYPGKPLAIFNKQSEKYTVLFATYYLDENKLTTEKNAEEKSTPSNYVYLPTRFYTGGDIVSDQLKVNNTYLVQHSKNIITAELSKKEKKKLGLD